MPRTTLSRISNDDLTGNLTRLVREERERLVDILHHLNEMRRRKLHLELGYSSLFDYCVTRLRYSESAAGRRLSAAGVLRRFPDVGDMLMSGEVSLTTVSMVSGLLTGDNATRLLERIRGRSRSEVERIVAEHRPRTIVRDRVRSGCVAEPAAPAASGGRVDASPGASSTPAGGSAPCGTVGGDGHAAARDALASARGSGTADGSGWGSASNGMPGGRVQPPAAAAVTMVHKHEIRFVAGDEFMDKVERLRSLLSNRLGHASFEQVFDAAMEAYLESNCPLRRAKRRRERKEQKTQRGRAASGPGTGGHESLPPAGVNARGVTRAGREGGRRTSPFRRPATAPSRYIPAALRDAVWRRDGGRCTFVGPQGRRCTSRRYLEIDHIVPVAFGGATALSNLHLLCRAHNLLAAERVLGHGVMTRYMRRE